MLQNIRDNSQGIIAKIIVSLIVVIFAAAGIESLLGNGGANSAGEINGEEVTLIELEQAIRIQQRRILEAMGENADPSLLDDEMVRKTAMEQLIQQKLLLQAAQKQGVSTSPLAIDQMIVGMPQFQQDGKFSAQLYENVLRSNGYSMAYFKQLLNNDVIIRQLSSGIAGSDFVTEQELSTAASIIGQKRSFDYLTLPIKDALSAVSITEEEVASYYQDNLAKYQREPKSKLSYIEVKQSDFIKPVSDEQIMAAYDLEVAEFAASEERKVSHILLEITDKRDEAQTQALALELKTKIAAGESFASIAETYSDDTGSAFVGGDLGYSNKSGVYPENFELAMFAAQQGEVVGPLSTESGIHLISVTDIKVNEKPSYEARREAIKQSLELSQAEPLFVRKLEQLRDLVFNSADLKEPAKELNLTVQQSDWIGRNDKAGVLSKPRVIKAAFSDEVLKDGNNSEVIELAADHYIVIRVLEHKPAEPQPLVEVQASISAQLQKIKATESLKAKADELLMLLRGSDLSFEQVIADKAYSVNSEQDVSRITAKASREISAAVFAMAKPKSEAASFAVHSLRNGDQVVVGLHSVVEGQLSDLSEGEQQAVRMQLYRANSSQSLEAYQQSIREKADISLM